MWKEVDNILQSNFDSWNNCWEKFIHENGTQYKSNWIGKKFSEKSQLNKFENKKLNPKKIIY